MHTIITPADLGGAALRALKEWLAISTANDDAALIRLLHAAVEICGAYTDTIPLAVTAEETHGARRDWRCLAARPVHGIIGVDALGTDGTRVPLPADAYDLELEGDGRGCFRVLRQLEANRIVLRYIAGLAPDWEGLPDALRHGIIRLAAQHFRERDAAAPLTPPTAVAALWRPWRRVRVA